MFFTSIATDIIVHNLDFIYTNVIALFSYTWCFIYSINILISIPLFLIFHSFFKKILLCTYIRIFLPESFSCKLAAKVSVKSLISYIFSLKNAKVTILTLSGIGSANLVSFFYYGTLIHFISPWSSGYILYILYITTCINLSNCYIHNIKVFTLDNLCYFLYYFVLLLSVKICVLRLMPFVCCLFLNLENNDINISSVSNIRSNIDISINKFLKLIKIIPLKYYICSTFKLLDKFHLIHKTNLYKYISINNIRSDYCLNLAILRAKSNNAYLYCNNNTKFLCNPRIGISPFAFHIGKAFTSTCSILNAVNSLEIISSRLMLSYSDNLDSIVLDRVTLVYCRHINQHFAHSDHIGSLPKSGYFNNLENNAIALSLEKKSTFFDSACKNYQYLVKHNGLNVKKSIYNNLLLDDTYSNKLFSDSGLVNVTKSSIDCLQEINSHPDVTHLLPGSKSQYELYIEQDMNNVFPELLSPMVYMVDVPTYDVDENVNVATYDDNNPIINQHFCYLNTPI